MASYADDTAILSPGIDPAQSFASLQNYRNLIENIENWVTKWRIKINPEKSVHVNFTLKKTECPLIYFQESHIPNLTEVKYLGITLKRLTWGPHLKSKRKNLNSHLNFLSSYDQYSDPNYHYTRKNIIYKSLLRPMWANAIQIRSCAKPSQISTIQAFQHFDTLLLHFW